MEKHIVKIKSINKVTHDVLVFSTEKPENYNFEPGQATEIAINKQGWKEEGRPFTFTSLPHEEDLQFTIKAYPGHNGVTKQLLKLEKGDEFILHEVFGAINYKGQGVFIAGGAGVTPFIAIFRSLKEKNLIGQNKLIFGNKTSKDIILKEEFEALLGTNFIIILSEEKTSNYDHGMITKAYLEKYVSDFNQYFYVCGPLPMIEKVTESLEKLGVNKNKIVKEDL